MLIFNPKRMFKMRGIGRPWAALVKAGLSGGTATKILNYYNTRMTVEHVERMCVLLNCTPNDLFEWRSKPNETLTEDHALNSMKREGSPEDLSELIKKIPIDKLSQLDEFVRGLQNKD